MRKRDIRAALMMDHLHGRLFLYRNHGRPEIRFLPKNIPADLRDIDDPNVEWAIRSHKEEAIRDFFREARDALAGCTDIVLMGPGQAKEELAHALRDTAQLRDVPIRTYSGSWMDEPAFELWARAKLNVPEATPLVYVKAPRTGARLRVGGPPGAPVAPERHQRTNELKRPQRFEGKGLNE